MKNFLILILLITGFLNAQIQVGSTTLEEREVVDGLDVPWEIKWGPDSGGDEDFLWVTERSGLVSRINVATGEKHVILDIEIRENSIISGMNGVAMARHGLILWENEATGSRKLSKCLRGKNKTNIQKQNKVAKK